MAKKLKYKWVVAEVYPSGACLEVFPTKKEAEAYYKQLPPGLLAKILAKTDQCVEEEDCVLDMLYGELYGEASGG